jgi:glucose-6-phosphate isomerase
MMMTNKMPLNQRAAWKALQAHAGDMHGKHMRQLFVFDPARGQRLTAEAVGVYLDYSKNRVTDETLKLLVELVEQSDLRGHIEAMFQGEKINIKEKRAV